MRAVSRETHLCLCSSAWRSHRTRRNPGAVEAGEHVFTFSDDIHVVSLPERTRTIFNLAAEKLGAGAGIELHAGKTRVWNRAGECPLDMVELGDDVWNAAGMNPWDPPLSVGTREFAQAACATEEEDKLWQAIKWTPDLQCAWQVLVQCAAQVTTILEGRLFG